MRKKVKVLSHTVMSDPLRPIDYIPQAPLSMGFSRQEYWSGLPFPPPGDLHDPGVKPLSRAESPGKRSLLFNRPQMLSQVKPSCYLRLSQSYWRTVSGSLGF